MRYQIKCNDIVIARKTKVASSFMARLIGLMFKKNMDGFDGLLIRGTNSIHTCFMRYEIDVVFLNKDYRVIKVVRNMKPWRFTWICFFASQVLELPGGSLTEMISKNDQLEVICTN